MPPAIDRILEYPLKERLFQGRVVVLYGPRRAGKTTLVKKVVASFPDKKTLWLNGDNPPDAARLAGKGVDDYRALAEGYDFVVVDEAQRVPEIGTVLKLFADHVPGTQVIATGSSSFELAGKVNEPLTGRKFALTLLPLSLRELGADLGKFAAQKRLPFWLVHGTYPEISQLGEAAAQERLAELAESYLYRDLFSLDKIRKPETLKGLVRLLALQIGQEVSFPELASALKTNVATVLSYVGLLEQAFVVFQAPGFSRNLRKEIAKSRKVYFYDVGIRNAVLGRFQVPELRDDVGHLWENFVAGERMKSGFYENLRRPEIHFWRTYDQQEIDLVETSGDGITAWECKWNPAAKWRAPKAFREAYPQANARLATPGNLWEWA